MKDLGVGLMLAGVGLATAALLVMSPAVSAADGTSVYNLAAGQNREFAFNAGLCAIIVGGLLYTASILETAIMRAGGFRRKGSISSLRQVDEATDDAADNDKVL